MRIFLIGKREMYITVMCLMLAAAIIFALPKGIEAVSASATQRKLPIYSVQTDKKQIALTFDAAWGNSDTDKLIEILKKYNARATFFYTGEWVSKYPEDVLKLYAAGHEAANHSDAHKHINSMSEAELEADITACNKKIEAIVGKMPTLYRGPYGEYNDVLLNCVQKLGMYTIQWDTDSRDWQKKSVDEMVSSVTKNAKNGSILLFHNDVENTPAALEIILERLKNEGYEFVLVNDLIYKENFHVDSRGVQCKDK